LNFVVEVRRLLAVVLAAVLFTSYQKYPEEHGVIQHVTLWLRPSLLVVFVVRTGLIGVVLVCES